MKNCYRHFFKIKRLLESQNKINLGKAFTLSQYFLHIKNKLYLSQQVINVVFPWMLNSLPRLCSLAPESKPSKQEPSHKISAE